MWFKTVTIEDLLRLLNKTFSYSKLVLRLKQDHKQVEMEKFQIISHSITNSAKSIFNLLRLENHDFILPK